MSAADRPVPHSEEDPRPAPVPSVPNRAFVLSCVDQPRPNDRVRPGDMLSGRGWAISESPIDAVGVFLGDTFLCHASYGQPRPEIGRDFSHYPQSHHAGFVFEARLPGALEIGASVDLRFRFTTENGSESWRHVRLTGPNAAPEAGAADDAADRPWPIRLALDECRIDLNGRLRIRGWAAARQPLQQLSVFLNGDRLQAPETGIERPDIATKFPGYPNAASCGFRLIQMVDPALADEGSVRVVARAGGLQRQIVVPLSTRHKERRLIEQDDISLCCEILHHAADGMLTVTGWAVAPTEIREIELVASGASLGLAETGLPRPDIGNRFPQLPSARFAGFRYHHVNAALSARRLLLRVRRVDASEQRLVLRLPGPAETADGPSPEPDADDRLHAGIDASADTDLQAVAPRRGPVSITGWAVAESGIADVSIWSDDIAIGTAYIGMRREDIAATYPDIAGSLTSGFALAISPRLIGAGEHLLRAVIRAKSGAITEVSVRVRLNADDEDEIGLLRRVIPLRETRLRLALLARYGTLPHVTILLRCGAHDDPKELEATLDSLRLQSLPSWRAILAAQDASHAERLRAACPRDEAVRDRISVVSHSANQPLWNEPAALDDFDLLCVMRVGDRLGANALMEFAVELRLSTASFVYADERYQDAGQNALRPFYKPGWSPALLLSMNYIGRCWCARRGLVERADIGLRSFHRFGEYDAVLRLTEQAESVAHLPMFLAERHARHIDSPARELEAVQRALRRTRQAAVVQAGLVPGSFRIRRKLKGRPLVSIIIPTCGARGLIRTAIVSLRTTTSHQPIEIIIVDDVPPQQRELKAWLRQAADRVIPAQGSFNWSRANNFGARAARGEFLLFLNDDTECSDPGWLIALLEAASEPDVGAVGAKLLYPDGKVQHAGMFLRGLEGLHAFRFAGPDDPGPFGIALVAREVTAVTGACLLTRRDVFESMGGFDEAHTVIKNDLDFCLRLGAKGLRVIYTPHAGLVHHEMASRAPLPDNFDALKFDGSWALRAMRGDPLLNPNLSRESVDYEPEYEPVELLQPGCPLFDGDQVRRILIVKLDHIGDFICALPAIERLRALFPKAVMTLIGASASLALAPLTSAVDDCIQFDFFSAKSIAGRRHIDDAELDRLAQLLRPRHFDIAVDLRMHGETRHILQYTGATWLAGFDHDGRFSWLNIAVPWEGDIRRVPKASHITDRLLHLVDAIGNAADARRLDAGQAAIAPPAEAAMLSSLPAAFSGRKLVCIHPGAGTPLKQWPPASYAGLARLLLADHDVAIVLVGSQDEAAMAAEVAQITDRPDALVSLAGRVSLAALPSLLSQCVLFVGNDSGPKHLAASLGIPAVGIHAHHVDAAEWGPLGVRGIAVRRRVVCGPCYIAEESDCPRNVACLRGILPADVYRACRLLLGFAGPASSSTLSAGDGTRISS